ncbi:triggering receptor expressed on myeloid cells 1 [Pteropus medius]|uniref:Triggering receptor expressed on myeloid cells 1 n=1 Tax=Pteropus vampyrus TaxID=132908 RepID=A0A6P3PV21_PTEVA|nr:triggering receptor expressed on myeloid cells 1 [Pteropus vampyrus]XP_039710326.1 triggering receptor expressed on myeloid cells 1 [Pteropus giganteus]
MRKVRLSGLLWMFFISELQAATDLSEEEFTLEEGKTLEVDCPFSRELYLYSQKAWQRLTAGSKPVILAKTEKGSGMYNKVQVGRYHLEEIPEDSVLRVQMTDLQVEDSGLYQCVIYQPPKDPVILFYPVRLVVTKGPSGTPFSDKNPTQSLTPNTILPPITLEVQSTLHTRPRAVTQLLPMSTATLSSPGLGVNPTQGPDVIRISLISIVVFVVCGILSKSLVFTILLVVTQRSFGP